MTARGSERITSITTAHIAGAYTTGVPQSIAARIVLATGSGTSQKGGGLQPSRHRRAPDSGLAEEGPQAAGGDLVVEAFEIRGQPRFVCPIENARLGGPPPAPRPLPPQLSPATSQQPL